MYRTYSQSSSNRPNIMALPSCLMIYTHTYGLLFMRSPTAEIVQLLLSSTLFAISSKSSSGMYSADWHCTRVLVVAIREAMINMFRSLFRTTSITEILRRATKGPYSVLGLSMCSIILFKNLPEPHIQKRSFSLNISMICYINHS